MNEIALIVGWAVLVIGGVALAIYLLVFFVDATFRSLRFLRLLWRAMYRVRKQEDDHVVPRRPAPTSTVDTETGETIATSRRR